MPEAARSVVVLETSSLGQALDVWKTPAVVAVVSSIEIMGGEK